MSERDLESADCMPRYAIPMLTVEANLKRAVRRHLRELGFVTRDGELVHDELTKDDIRRLYRVNRRENLKASRRIRDAADDLIEHFADGKEVRPSEIRPLLERIDGGTWQSDLFAFATLWWSVPTSEGYGRRLRFLVWDENNGKLLGLLALGDPVFNLRARDEYIGWSGIDRKKRLSCAMNAYVLGALPPYNMILGGKLVACLLRSTEVSEHFRKKYSNKRTIIAERKERRELALITTTSSLGRSSVYNRVRVNGDEYLRAIGSTSGFGHFHIPDGIFARMREYLIRRGHKYANANAYGQGANWRMRVIREALTSLGMSPQLVRHGIAREVYACETAENSCAFLRGEAKRLAGSKLKPAEEIAAAAIGRWLVPRAERDPSFQTWTRDDTLWAMGLRRGARPRGTDCIADEA